MSDKRHMEVSYAPWSHNILNVLVIYLPCHTGDQEHEDGLTHPCHLDTAWWGLYEPALTLDVSSVSLT